MREQNKPDQPKKNEESTTPRVDESIRVVREQIIKDKKDLPNNVFNRREELKSD